MIPARTAVTDVVGSLTAEQPVLLIPAYKPSRALPELVCRVLKSRAIAGVVVVNDGSGSEYEPVFADLRDLPNVLVLDHFVNLGKGAALKTGLNYAACAFPCSVGVVTADADGQHTPADIVATAEALSADRGSLVLGSRRFDGNIPLRSRFGNTITKFIMRLVTGQKLRDTQTGLRGIPREFLASLLRLKTSAYDFELDMLVQCKYNNLPISEIPIATIYIEGNRSSHFSPLRDSMRIYFILVRFAAVSVFTSAIDNIVFILALMSLPELWACQALARLIAGTFNYCANKKGVFHSSAGNKTALPRYWLSVIVAGYLSYLLIQAFVKYAGMRVVAAKVVAESIMFLCSFVVQRDFVFYHADPQKEV